MGKNILTVLEAVGYAIGFVFVLFASIWGIESFLTWKVQPFTYWPMVRLCLVLVFCFRVLSKKRIEKSIVKGKYNNESAS